MTEGKKMAIPRNAEPGIEPGGKGNVILLEKPAQEDQARAAISRATIPN